LALPSGFGGTAEAGLLGLPALAHGGDTARLVDLPLGAGVGEAALGRRFPLGASRGQSIGLFAAPALAFLVEERVDVDRWGSIGTRAYSLLGAPARLDGRHLLLMATGEASLRSRHLALDLALPFRLDRG